MRHFLIVGAATALLASSGHAASAAAARPRSAATVSVLGAEATTPPAVAAAIREALRDYGKISIGSAVAGPDGLMAVAVTSGRHRVIVWALDGGKVVLLGTALTPDGTNLSHDAAIALRLIPKPLAPAALAEAVSAVHPFVIGQRGPELTAFMDPNCIWCHRLYEEAVPLVSAGKLRLRVVLVGFLKPSSFAKAVTILGSPDPAQALAFDEDHFDVTHESGGSVPARHIPPDIGNAVTKNTKLLAASGQMATPTFLFEAPGHVWQVIHGFPRAGISTLLAAMDGKTAAPAASAGAGPAKAGD
ncbi:MAG: hypothetical protein ACREFP_20490 [Acetobacteraceae bacterium]